MEQAKSFIANLDANKTMSWFTKKKPDGSKSDNEEGPKGSPQAQPQVLPQAPPQPFEEGDASSSGQMQYKGVHGLYNPLAWENMPKSLRDQFPHWKDNTSSVPAAGGASTEESERKFQFPSSFKQPDNTIPYVVMEHDTLNGIALKFDTTPSQLAHLNRKQLGMVTIIPGEVLYVPDSQRGEGEEESSSLFLDDSSPKSAPPELKAFLFPASQRPLGDGRGTDDPSQPERGGHPARQGGDAREVRSASPNLGTSNEIETTTIACTYVTEDQGCVRGTLIFSASSIHFRPDPADRLVQEKGEDSYDIQMLIQDLVFVGLSGDPHCAVNQRARKPGGTAQPTVTQEERAVQPQALSDNSSNEVSAANKMTASVELSSSGSGSRRESQGCPPVQSGSPARMVSTASAQASPSQKRQIEEGQKSSPLKSGSAPALHQGGFVEGKERVQPDQDSSALKREAASSEAAMIARAVSSQGEEMAQPAKDTPLQGNVASQGVPDQDKPLTVAASSELKPLSDVAGVKSEEPDLSTANGMRSGVEAGSLPKEECDFAQDKGSPSKGTPGTPCKDGGVVIQAPSPSGATGSSEPASVTSSPSKPTDGCADVAMTISTPKKDSYTAVDSAGVSEIAPGGFIPVAFEVGLSPLKLDASSISIGSGGGVETVSTPVKDLKATLVPSDSALAFDPDKTIVASEDPLVVCGAEQSVHTFDTRQMVEEAGVCKEVNHLVTDEAEAKLMGGGTEVPLERSEHLEGKDVVGVDPLSKGPGAAQAWDESHEKCSSPTDDVRFLNVCISNKSHQKYTYMPVTIGYALPKHLQCRNSFVRTGFCFAVPDSSIDGIVASVMRHHPSARTPAKQARESAVIINLEEPEELVVSNEHFEHDWEIYSWGTEDTREPSPEPLPVLRDKADLLDEKLVRQLAHELLPKAISCDWILLYSTFKHGISLQTLYRNIREYDEDSPLLLVVRDEYHKKFGVMLSSTMRISTHFLGTGESYLFSVEEFGKLQIYHWSGINDYIFQGNSDSMVFGSDEGHFGLWLHESLLRGTSSPCATFNNPCLSTKPEFECTGVEVWGFVRSH